MKQRKNLIKIILIGIIGVLLAIAYAQRYRFVNQKLKGAPIKAYSIGEEVKMEQDILINYTMEGYSIRVNQAEVLSYKEFLKKYHAEDEYSYVPDKIYDVEVTLRNIDANDETGVNLSEFYVQGAAVCAGLDTNLLEQVNSNLKGVYEIALRKNSSITIHLPFGLYEENFKKDVWSHLNDFKMNFVATLYPTKKIVHLYAQ
ncbi:hypothetical protein C806_00432 [Lachnospiraceae bacterium 3-1]|nr:hypothetical protein C806_00432 [Lachnospiraceae bacterium 3-1]